MNGWWLSEARRIGGEIRGFSPKAGTRVSSCRSFWSEKSTRFPPSIAIESLKPLVWPKSEVGFASNHWFGPNRGRVLLQTIGLAQIVVGFCFKPPGLTPIGGRFCFKPPDLTPIGVGFCFKPPGLTPIVGRFCFKPPGLAPIGVGFASNHLVWPQSRAGFGSNHLVWLQSGSGLLQTTWFGSNRGRFCFKPPGLAPIGVGFASKAIPILGLVRAESKDPAPARGGTGS